VERHYDPILKDSLYTERLDNGLTVAVLVKPGFQEATARIAVHYGSVDSRFIDPRSGQEVQVPDGIAHFLEHKLFESEDGSVADRFSELGAESNAYTTYTHTVYYFNTTRNFDDALRLLLDFVQDPWFTDESVAKEQGIIEQEIRMYMDDPGWRSNANLLEALYVHHPVRIDIAGTLESIRQITKETLYLCHRVFYHPSNMILFAAGDLDPEHVLKLVQESFSGRKYEPQGTIIRLLPEEPPTVNERMRVQQLVVSQPLFRLGFKDHQVGLRGRALLEQDLLTAILMDVICGRGSELYTRLYESGLIDHRFGFSYNPDETFAYSCFAGPTRDPGELEARLLAGIAEAREKGISEADFRRVRNKTIGRIISMMNDVDTLAYLCVDGAFKGISLFDFIPVAQQLTVEAANQRLRSHFLPEYVATSIIYPK